MQCCIAWLPRAHAIAEPCSSPSNGQRPTPAPSLITLKFARSAALAVSSVTASADLAPSDPVTARAALNAAREPPSG
eukprot:355096-Chlamydomonas_euryale.AAC.6